ncbi:Retrovirus-related Pol polyprotein from transposon opus [Dictyocoela muelleri]|nr:Retrovirus-related Pol polyprotein from transposon opus [Dictyocoela muelleri]
MNEPCSPIKVIEIPETINENKIKGILDTSFDKNYITAKTSEKLQLKPTFMKNPERIQIADGRFGTINREVHINFTLFDDNKNIFKVKFHIIEEPYENVIIGMKFLKENDVIIDFKNDKLNLDGREYKLNGNGNDMCFADSKLIEASRTYNISTNKENLNKIIEKYKSKNHLLGNIGVIEHSIVLTNNFSKILPQYPVPMGIRNDVKQHISELIQAGIISESTINYISPAFVIRKKNGKIRLVVDYRYLISITKKTHQYIPKISEILLSLKGAKYFSQIDLNQGYYQIHMNKSDIEKTGFRILNKIYVLNKMPFMLSNAPSTFQLAMNKLLKDILDVFVYLDDILLYSTNFEDHLALLNTVLNRLYKSGVSINFEKSNFALNSVKYLGHIITQSGIKPEISKIDEINTNTIKTKKKLERLLGFFNWFRPFVKDLSLLTANLYEKL